LKKALDKAVDKLTLGLSIVAGVLFILIVIILLINIILRSAFDSGITGQYEIVQYGIMICVGLGLSRTTFANRHIHVDLIVNHFSWRIKSAVEFIGRLICTATYGFATFLFIETADNAAKYFKVTDLYHIPFQYIYWVFFVILAITTLVFLYQTIVYFVGMFVNYEDAPAPEAVEEADGSANT